MNIHKVYGSWLIFYTHFYFFFHFNVFALLYHLNVTQHHVGCFSLTSFSVLLYFQDEYLREDGLSLRNLTLLLSYMCIFGVCSRFVTSIYLYLSLFKGLSFSCSMFFLLKTYMWICLSYSYLTSM